MASTSQFLRTFLRPDAAPVLVEETTFRRGDETLDATLYRPRRADRPLPGWVALHGLTVLGRRHRSLDRFARALAASGAVVLVPDLPQWRALDVAPALTVRTIKAAVLELDSYASVERGRVGAMGFSFGATQALIASTDPELGGHLAAVAAWGGYGDMWRVTRFAFTGRHELDGAPYFRDPDPYGRWILAGNYLTLAPGHERHDAAAAALKQLALEAGRHGILSWAPEMDIWKERLRSELDPEQRALFDDLAPPAAGGHPRAAAPGSQAARSGTVERGEVERLERLERLAESMANAAVAREPLLDPAAYLPRVTVPVFVAHGREDRLIPWTEMERLRRALPTDRVRRSGITSLFGHSTGERRLPTPRMALEAGRFVALLRSMLNLI